MFLEINGSESKKNPLFFRRKVRLKLPEITENDTSNIFQQNVNSDYSNYDHVSFFTGFYRSKLWTFGGLWWERHATYLLEFLFLWLPKFNFLKLKNCQWNRMKWIALWKVVVWRVHLSFPLFGIIAKNSFPVTFSAEVLTTIETSRQTMTMRLFLLIGILIGLSQARSTNVDPNATLSFFFTADPQFGWGASYSGNEERYYSFTTFIILTFRYYVHICNRRFITVITRSALLLTMLRWSVKKAFFLLSLLSDKYT